MDPQPVTPAEPRPSRFPLLPAFLILLFSLSTGFLGYQNWQLRKKITSLKSLPSLTPTPKIDPVINWKTYTNSDYGFSFKYPNNWILVDNPMSDTTSTITKDKKPHQINVNNEIGETMMLINPELPLGYGSPFTKSADILDKKRVDVYTYGSSPTKHNTNFGLSAFPNFSIDTHGNAPELEQVLSTFQFLEQTENWKTYTNTPMGFQLQYPGDWTVISEVQIVKLGPNNLSYLTISKNYSEDISSLKDCVFPSQVTCLIGKGITNTALDNIPAKSAYVTLGGMVDNDTRIIQTVQKPTIELQMSIFIDGNDQLFDQILSTFQFTSD